MNGQGKAITESWHELAWPTKGDDRSGDEIALDILARFNRRDDTNEPA